MKGERYMDENVLIKELSLFDRSYEPSVTLYDHLPYTRDVSFCTYTPNVYTTGNIIKFYQYRLGKPQIIQVPDEVFEIPEYRLRKNTPETVSEPEPSEKDDAVNALLTDISSTEQPDGEEVLAEESASEEAPEKYVVPAFDDLDEYD